MASIADLPADSRRVCFLNTSSRFSAIITHAKMFVEGNVQNQTKLVRDKVKDIKGALLDVGVMLQRYPLVEDRMIMEYRFLQWPADIFLRDASLS